MNTSFVGRGVLPQFKLKVFNGCKKSFDQIRIIIYFILSQIYSLPFFLISIIKQQIFWQILSFLFPSLFLSLTLFYPFSLFSSINSIKTTSIVHKIFCLVKYKSVDRNENDRYIRRNLTNICVKRKNWLEKNGHPFQIYISLFF